MIFQPPCSVPCFHVKLHVFPEEKSSADPSGCQRLGRSLAGDKRTQLSSQKMFRRHLLPWGLQSSAGPSGGDAGGRELGPRGKDPPCAVPATSRCVSPDQEGEQGAIPPPQAPQDTLGREPRLMSALWLRGSSQPRASGRSSPRNPRQPGSQERRAFQREGWCLYR